MKKHTTKRLDKNTVEYRGHEITKYPHLRGYNGHYQIGTKHRFQFLFQAKAWVDSELDKPTEDQRIEEARQYALGRGIPLQSFEHLLSFAPDNVRHFEDQESQECQDMLISTIYANIESFEAGEWYEEAYRFEGAEKFKRGY